MYRFAYGMMGNEADAQDVLQEVFIKIWEKRNDISIELNWKIYLMQMVRNRCLDVLKKYKRRSEVRILEEMPYIISDDVHSNYEQKELLEWVEMQINKLPLREKNILYLITCSRRNRFY